MKTLILLASLLYLSGCAINGDVLIYSPGGDVDRATELDSNVGLK